MIRINLLGRSRPKAQRTSVPLEATLQYVMLAIALVVSLGALYGHYLLLDRPIPILRRTSRSKRVKRRVWNN